MFCTASDFDLIPHNIPNLDDVANTFAAYLDAAEKEVLQMVLGPVLYDQFIAGLAIDPLDDKWKNLRDGATYSLNNVNYKYNGVKDFLIPYIYAVWTRDNFDNDTAVGVSLATIENAEAISPAARICRAYNKFSVKVGGWDHSIHFCNTNHNTLFEFLHVNKLIYPDWFFTNPGTMNIWGI